MAQTLEQRAEPRVKCAVKVSCISDFKVFEAKADDISVSGAGIKSPKGYAAGEDLVLVFNASCARRLLTVPAQVVWSDLDQAGTEPGYRIGVKYLYLNREHKRIFRDFMAVCH